MKVFAMGKERDGVRVEKEKNWKGGMEKKRSMCVRNKRTGREVKGIISSGCARPGSDSEGERRGWRWHCE